VSGFLVADVAAPEVIVFDVDGVLVEVTASYRETVRATVRHFTGDDVSNDVIQEYKNAGGWNNDWDLTHKFVLDRGNQVDYKTVVDRFNHFFLGENGDGLINCEKWIPHADFLETLSKQASLAIFTGRLRYELEPTLNRFARHIPFQPAITADDVENQKPAPDGLHIIQRVYPGRRLWYLGDTVDDARSAADAGVPFVGVSSITAPRHEELTERLTALGAIAILGDVNQLPGLLEAAARGRA
jgi:HAD superfamily hydrolase (TIGR01548 family)